MSSPAAGSFGPTETASREEAAPATGDQRDPLELYRRMRLVRTVETEIEALHRSGRMSGSFHSSVGQEGCAVGVCAALRCSDIVTSTHRGHGHALAKGVSVEAVFAELFGRQTGVSGGRGGSMHLHDRPSGFYGQNAIVGGGVPWAAGAAWARRRRGRDDVAVAFIGDGAFAQGATHESLLLARHWGSPCIIVCENNGLAHSMPSERLFGEYGNLAAIVAATGMASRFVDGRDVLEVLNTMSSVVEIVRESGRPAFVECGVFRVRPHSLSDPDYRYRPRDSGEEWLRVNDPVARLRQRLELDHGSLLDAIDGEIEARVRDAVRLAEAAPQTAAAAARENIYATAELSSDA
jgi:TPP-dependent pyruvate/acetoin dehydrogenase alpha subunit